MSWILSIVMVISLLTFYFNSKGLYAKKTHQYLGIQLSPTLLEDEHVNKILNAYQNNLKRWLVLSALSIVPVFWMGTYFAVVFSYLMVWFVAVPVTLTRSQIIGGEALKRIKREKGCYQETKASVIVDTKASEAKIKGLPGIEIHLIAVLIGVLPLVLFSHNDKWMAWVFLGITVVTTSSLYFAQVQTKRSKNQVYTGDADLNIELNTLKKRELMYLYAGLSVFQAFINMLIYFMLTAREQAMGPFIVILTAACLMPLIGIFTLQWRQQRRLENRLGDKQSATLEATLTDEECYWYGGMFYINPYNQKTFVNRKTGLGSTVNLGNRRGKMMIIGTIIFTTLLILPLWGMIIFDEITPPTVSVESGVVHIKAGIYGETFLLDDIRSLEWVDDIGPGMKTNGSATGRYSRGHFNLNHYGPAELYIFTESKPYLVIKLADKILIYSGLTPEETRAVYKLLNN